MSETVPETFASSSTKAQNETSVSGAAAVLARDGRGREALTRERR